jgi:hypothetical protein
MQQERRSLVTYRWPQLASYSKDHWDEPDELQLVLAELKYRRRKSALLVREQVIERLVELSEEAFIWPRTVMLPSSEALDGDQFAVQQGLLSSIGYRVGQQGAYSHERRDILDQVYNRRLPQVHSAEYMSEWSEPKTATRLRKLAYSLAALTKNAKGRATPMLAKAISEWEADLEYLRVKYYAGRYDGSFRWPQS